MWDLERYKVDESFNESVREGNREKFKRKNNYVKIPFRIYAKNVKNATNIFCTTINKEE